MKLYDKRITGSIDLGYSDKVLIVNWFEKRANRSLITQDLVLTSTYSHNYKEQSREIDMRSIWDNRFNGEGSFGTQGHTSMATAYDLAFRCKVQDYVTGDYGNATGYSKKECKQGYWASLANDRRIRFHTEYKDAYSFTPCISHNAS